MNGTAVKDVIRKISYIEITMEDILKTYSDADDDRIRLSILLFLELEMCKFEDYYHNTLKGVLKND